MRCNDAYSSNQQPSDQQVDFQATRLPLHMYQTGDESRLAMQSDPSLPFLIPVLAVTSFPYTLQHIRCTATVHPKFQEHPH